VVFCGSSNLVAGEVSYEDNLLAVDDKRIAISYAVEVLRMFDTYWFRSVHEQSGSNKPLMLKSADG
jgi:hypothetical protein